MEQLQWLTSRWPWLTPIALLPGWLARHRIGSLWRALDRATNPEQVIASLRNQLDLCGQERDQLYAAVSRLTTAAAQVQTAVTAGLLTTSPSPSNEPTISPASSAPSLATPASTTASRSVSPRVRPTRPARRARG